MIKALGSSPAGRWGAIALIGIALIALPFALSQAGTAWVRITNLAILFTLLALTYLAIQYLLALRRTAFLAPLGALALAEPVLLLTAAPSTPDGFAAVVLAVQAVAAVVALGLAFARPSPAR